MHCKDCNYPATRVVDTHQDDMTDQVFRRRECVKCGVRFTTREHMRDDYRKEPYKTLPPNKQHRDRN